MFPTETVDRPLCSPACDAFAGTVVKEAPNPPTVGSMQYSNETETMSPATAMIVSCFFIDTVRPPSSRGARNAAARIKQRTHLAIFMRNSPDKVFFAEIRKNCLILSISTHFINIFDSICFPGKRMIIAPALSCSTNVLSRCARHRIRILLQRFARLAGARAVDDIHEL